MEKIFDVFKCTGQERVQLAAYMLRGTAEMWWKSVKTPFATVEDETAWESFSTLFRTKFIPPHITALKVAEFETLQQGENSVQVYDQQFTNLSRFAPSLVKTEADKVMRFIRGLNPKIKGKVTSVTLTTYEENLKRAYWAEETIREKALYVQNLRQIRLRGGVRLQDIHSNTNNNINNVHSNISNRLRSLDLIRHGGLSVYIVVRTTCQQIVEWCQEHASSVACIVTR